MARRFGRNQKRKLVEREANTCQELKNWKGYFQQKCKENAELRKRVNSAVDVGLRVSTYRQEPHGNYLCCTSLMGRNYNQVILRQDIWCSRNPRDFISYVAEKIAASILRDIGSEIRYNG